MAKEVNHGHAVYLEFHDAAGKGNVLQALLIGAGTSGEKVLPMRILSRTITPDTPQLKWRPQEVKTDMSRYVSADMKLSRDERPEAAISLAVENYTELSQTIEAATSFNWNFYGEPIVVQVSPLDYLDLKNNQSPKKLLDRIRNIRNDLGWDALPAAKGKGV